MIANAHFLRPLWLLALLPAALLLWQAARARDPARGWRGIVAEHLLPHLLTRGSGHAGRGPLTLLAVLWALCCLALAGPSWRRAPSPFAEDTAALVIVVEVAPSMRAGDVQPDRLSRAVQKIHDLLALRAGARSALVAYAGSAHVAVPLTRDGEIIDTFAGALDPSMMPSAGDAAGDALLLAARVLSGSGRSGSILWITDGVAPEQCAAVAAARRDSFPAVRVLAPLPPGVEADALRRLVGEVTLVRPDDADVRALARQAKFAKAGAGGSDGERWRDEGWWLTPVIALLALMWARPGWIVAGAVDP